MAQSADDELRVALARFNEGLEQQRAEKREQQAIDKAERRKQQAATALRRIQADPGASGDDKVAAEAAYRSAVQEFNRVRTSGGPAGTETTTDPTGPPTTDSPE